MTTILILEDNLELALYWKEILEAKKYAVSCCSKVSGALDFIQERFPDLLIVDMLLKEGSRTLTEGGLTLLGKLQLMNISNYSPAIIGVSAYKRSPYLYTTPLEIAETMGLDIALYKPISSMQLAESVELLLTSKGLAC